MSYRSQSAIDQQATRAIFNLHGGPSPAVYFLKNNKGMFAAVSQRGSRLLSLLVPIREKLVEVIDGLEELQCHGGSPANGDAAFSKPCITLDKFNEREYLAYITNKLTKLAADQLNNWSAEQLNDKTVTLNYFASDLGEGAPGYVSMKVTYALTGDNGLKVEYQAASTNIVQSNPLEPFFFNLNGAGSGGILGHIVQINADQYVTANCVNSFAGTIEDVVGTPFDFRKATSIGARINDNNEQLKSCDGYNHNFILNKHSSRTPVARVKGDKNNIIMEVCTEDPALLFCSGDPVQSKNVLKEGKQDFSRAAFAMETPYFPGSADQNQFWAKLFKPGQVYKSAIIYRFKASE